jgi:CRP-like cAMP-binding protein
MPQRGSSKSIVTPPPKPPEREEVTLDLDPDLGPVESLPEDAILTPSAEDLASSPDEEEIALDEEIKPAAAPPPSKPLKPAPPPRPKPPEITITDEILIEEEEEAPKSPRVASAAAKKAQRPPPEGPGGSVPIADLLSSDSEEEVELLSITSDEEVADRPISGAKPPSPDDMDLDSAFGKLAPQAGAQPKRVPTKKVPLFDDLSQEAFVELVNKLSYHRHVPGQLIIREGDPGRSFFIIVEGKVRIYKTADDKEITIAHLGEGAFFGEMALLSGAPRTANVVAEEDTEILEVTDRVLRELASHHPQVVNSLKNFYRQRLLNNVMAISPLFKDFDPAERKQIVSMFRMKQAAPGGAHRRGKEFRRPLRGAARSGAGGDGQEEASHRAGEAEGGRCLRRDVASDPPARHRHGDLARQLHPPSPAAGKFPGAGAHAPADSRARLRVDRETQERDRGDPAGTGRRPRRDVFRLRAWAVLGARIIISSRSSLPARRGGRCPSPAADPPARETRGSAR